MKYLICSTIVAVFFIAVTKQCPLYVKPSGGCVSTQKGNEITVDCD